MPRTIAFVSTLIALLAVSLVSSLVSATPITYIYSGTGTGQIGSSTFSNTNFTITALADTNNITSWPSASFGPQNPHLSTVIDITSLGSFSITTPSHSWATAPFTPDRGGLGKNLGTNWITFTGSGFANYGLNTAKGPLLEVSPEDVAQFHDVSTSGGLLKFTSISPVTFTAIITPEPSSLLLLGISAIRLSGCRRRVS